MSPTPTSEQIGATVPADVADAIRGLARKNERSFSAEVRVALRNHAGLTTDPDSETVTADDTAAAASS